MTIDTNKNASPLRIKLERRSRALLASAGSGGVSSTSAPTAKSNRTRLHIRLRLKMQEAEKERRKKKETKSATFLQSHVRGRAARIEFNAYKAEADVLHRDHSATLLQAHHRRRVEKKAFAAAKRAAIRLQALHRGRSMSQEWGPVLRVFKEMKEDAATSLQSQVRGWRQRTRHGEKKNAASVLQAMIRGRAHRTSTVCGANCVVNDHTNFVNSTTVDADRVMTRVHVAGDGGDASDGGDAGDAGDASDTSDTRDTSVASSETEAELRGLMTYAKAAKKSNTGETKSAGTSDTDIAQGSPSPIIVPIHRPGVYSPLSRKRRGENRQMRKSEVESAEAVAGLIPSYPGKWRCQGSRSRKGSSGLSRVRVPGRRKVRAKGVKGHAMRKENVRTAAENAALKAAIAATERGGCNPSEVHNLVMATVRALCPDMDEAEVLAVTVRAAIGVAESKAQGGSKEGAGAGGRGKPIGSSTIAKRHTFARKEFVAAAKHHIDAARSKLRPRKIATSYGHFQGDNIGSAPKGLRKAAGAAALQIQDETRAKMLGSLNLNALTISEDSIWFEN